MEHEDTYTPMDDDKDNPAMDWSDTASEDTVMDALTTKIQNISIGDTSTVSQFVRLKQSLKAILTEAKSVFEEWTDVDAKFDGGRSFSIFKWLLEMSGLDWDKYVSKEDELDVNHQLDRWSLEKPSYKNLTYCRNWSKANRYYDKTLSLKQLLLGISGDKFSQDQAKLLVDFLDHLIMVQQEQRVVVYGFSEHLEQLKKCNAASLLAFSSKVVDDEGDRDKCPFMLFKNHMDYYLCQQKHLFDSLHSMSRESAWWLRKFEASHSSNPLLVEQAHKILEIIMSYAPQFKRSKESLDQYLLDKNCQYVEDRMKELDLQNIEILDEFSRSMEDLQKHLLPSDDKKSVTWELLGFFASTVNEGKIRIDECRAEQSRNISFNSQSAYLKCMEETMRLEAELVSGLKFIRSANLSNESSPLERITYWRVIFEKHLLNLKLDLLCRKIGETTKLAVKLLNSGTNADDELSMVQNFAQLHSDISMLLDHGDGALLDFIAMHKTVAKITYKLGDAFTTGGVGLDDVSDEALPGTSNKANFDFPWDKHKVRDEIEFEIDSNDPQTQLLDVISDYAYGPDSDSEFV